MNKREQTWDILEEVLKSIEYKREQPSSDRFRLIRQDEDNYAILYIYTFNVNTYNRDKMRLTMHEFVVPVVTYHKEGWVRWVFDRIASIELHETTEHFFVDDVRVYSPHHSNGWDPYSFWPAHDVSEKLKAPGDE